MSLLSYLVYILLVIGTVYFAVTRLLPNFIGWVLIRRFKLQIKVGRFWFPVSFKNVQIIKNGYSVSIGELCVRSSFFNTEVTKLLSIYIRDIQINKDIDKSESSDSSLITRIENLKDTDGNVNFPDFRNSKVPPSIITFAQFMAIHINNVSIVLMNGDTDPGWFLYAKAKELHLDGSILQNAKTLLVNSSFNEAEAKVYRYCPSRRQSIENINNVVRPCLAELSFDVALDATLIAQGPVSVDNLNLSVNNAKTTIYAGLYDFLNETKQRTKPKIPKPSNNTSTKCNNEVYLRISPIIPKNFSFVVKAATFQSVKDISQTDFSAKIQLFKIQSKFSPLIPNDSIKLPLVHTKFQLQHLDIDTKYEKLLFIELTTFESVLENDVLNLYLKLKTFQLIYNHTEIFNWVSNNFLQRKSPRPMQLNSSANDIDLTSNIPPFIQNSSIPVKENKSSCLEWLLSRVIVKGKAEFWNLSTLMKIEDQNAAMSVSHMKFVLEQFTDNRTNIYKSKMWNLLLGNRHWSAELMIETLWWSLGNATNDTNNLRKAHSRGNPFLIGVSLFKLSSYANVTKLDISIHTLRTEYSMTLAEFVTSVALAVTDYGFGQSLKRNKSSNPKTGSDGDSGLIVSAKIKDIGTFFVNRYDCCFLASLQDITLTKTEQITILKMSDFQMAIMTSIKSSSLNLSDFSHFITCVKVIRMEYEQFSVEQQGPKMSVHMVGNSEATWNSNIHMHVLTLLRDMKALKEDLKKFIPRSPIESPEIQSPNIPTPISFELSAESNTIFEIKLSERHSLQLFFENMYISKKDRFLISVENIYIKIDDQHIFTLKDVDIQSRPKLDILTQERENCEGFLLRTNKVWITTIGSFKAIFPYDHDFYDAITNEGVSLFKWIKLVHGIQKKPFTVDSPLPSDMLIQIKEFLIEISDDPFEVKLRDNYVLLVDEYNESIKRTKLFEEKLVEKFKGRVLVPAGTIEKLRNDLTAKNAQIYIQRSKKIRESGPMRTRLLAWIMTDVQIMAMADLSIHGTENVTKIMSEIDADSPWPEEGLEFTTLWCRSVNVSCTEWQFKLRDFPQPMFVVKAMRLFGTLCGAEQAAPKRAKRDVLIEVGHPFGNDIIQRSMTQLKFYHDFDCELESFCYAFGPCWEPVMAQCNLSFEKISAPSRDPSPPLPFWDKMRLLFHGRLTMIVQQFTVLLHASLDPYNTTEEMDLTWNNCGIVWTNAKIIFKGELNVSVRTASRYDDVQLLHFPNLKLTFKLNWICLANPNDHHCVIPCAPDKLPEYSSNQVHDSFRAFRSQNLNIWISFETRAKLGEEDIPSLLLYGSTLRWFESLKLILSGVTRPTRRGPVFNNVRPRKKQLSRHYKKANLQMSLHKFKVVYWMSHALHKGFRLNGGPLSFGSEYNLTLNPIDDGLIHRLRADWSTIYMNCELNDAIIWLLNTSPTETNPNDEPPEHVSSQLSQNYFLSVVKVSYGREASIQSVSTDEPKNKSATPTHKLVVYNLKGAWTTHNRNIAFALFDSFMKSQKLKNNLSTEALKGFRKDSAKNSRNESSVDEVLPVSPPPSTTVVVKNPQKDSHAMLQQLIAEADHKFNVYSDDENTISRELQLQGLQACTTNDIIHENWSIALVNSQVVLKGSETSGYVIISAAKAEILQRVHKPVWRDRSLVSKTTWKGVLECMQYYATVSAREIDSFLVNEILWLTVENIQEKDSTVINDLPDLPHLVGSGSSVGGVVSETVGGFSGAEKGLKAPIQLQRIVSRCKCEFFYVSYGDSIDPCTLTEVPPLPEESLSPWDSQDDPVDAFTLMHHDLDVCTNSLQYAMILDIVNNLLLYVEPHRKQASEKLARMRFQQHLYTSEDQKRPIQQLQTQIRSLSMKIRALEKEIHLIRNNQGGFNAYEEVQKKIRADKEELNTLSEDLDMMLMCYKEKQLSTMSKITNVRADKTISMVRSNEICFKRAQWRLTETDGQIGIADLILSGFLYTKKSKSDDSVEHLLELGNLRMSNLIPREIYKEVICPTELQKDMPVDTHKRVLRVFCREKPPVGGISVKEHFEINVAPITIAITKKFYTTMLKFAFPDRMTADGADGNDDDVEVASTTSGSSHKSTKKAIKAKKSAKDSEFYVKNFIEKDDVEKMKERAEKNKLFIYIKIPEVPVRVSYKGNKEKNLEDITDFSLVVPTLEYHNVTWTWLDLLLAMKSVSRKVILSQAIKQKLAIHRRNPLTSTAERQPQEEEDKAKMLFGNRLASENRSQRGKGVFKLPSTSKPQ